MTATLKTTIIQEPSSATANLTLDTSGNVVVAGAITATGTPLATVTGTQTLTNKTLTSPTLNSPTINTPTMGGSVLTALTAQASTSGTAINFPSIPSWATRVTVLLAGVSTSGTSIVLVRMGTASGAETTGYLGSAGGQNTSAVGTSLFTTGFGTASSTTAANVRHGSIVLTKLTGNQWVASGTLGHSDAATLTYVGGSKTLAATLDRIQVTTVNGTDTFDAGIINVLYE